MSVYAGVTEPACLNSSAHCCSAPSICRRLLMQEFFCAVVLALMKLGIAMAANRPIMATTIMISTSVKPPLRAGLEVNTLNFLSAQELTCRRAGEYYYE